MTQIDFYILKDDNLEARWQFACRLAEKAWRHNRQVLIACDPEHSDDLDALLWRFNPESFIPHSKLEDDSSNPVIICSNNDPGEHHDFLINLASTRPSYFSRFQRLAEVVCQTPSALEQTRENWAFYRERGYPIQSHDMR